MNEKISKLIESVADREWDFQYARLHDWEMRARILVLRKNAKKAKESNK